MKIVCSRCGVEKSINNFYRDIKRPNGVRAECKECIRIPKEFKKDILAKQCVRCKIVKNLEDFTIDQRSSTGRSRQCLECSLIKKCRQCQENKHVDLFAFNGKSKDGYSSQCRMCVNLKSRERYKRNPQSRLRSNNKYRHKKGTREGTRERMLLQKYNLSLDQYQQLLIDQNHCCKICNKNEKECSRGLLAVDHDHNTNQVRGLLCDVCNRGLGMFMDDTLLLEKAKQYLLMHSRFG